MMYEEYKMRIHRKKPSERNPYIAIVLYYVGDGSIGGYARTLQHKGIEIGFLVERDMLPVEKENTKQSWRIHWITYSTWEGLIEDEFLVTKSRTWCQEIIDAIKIEKTLDDIISTGMQFHKKTNQLILFPGT